ncbi:MAG: hypothetical protein ACK6EB_14905, partial [Planctomyces sp.]
MAAENHRPNLEGSLTPDGQLKQLAAQAAALSPADRGRLADYLTELMFEDVDSDLDLPDTLIDDLVSESDDVALR